MGSSSRIIRWACWSYWLTAAVVCAASVLYTTAVLASSQSDEFIYGAENDGSDDVDGQFGPYDYYRPPKGAISLVERAHMGFIIAEQVSKKDWSGYCGSLDYALRAIPNHPRALVLMAEFLDKHPPCPAPRQSGQPAAKLVSEIVSQAWQEHNADFYFRTAIRFMAEDTHTIPKRPETPVLYGNYLLRKGRVDEALVQYKNAFALDARRSDAHYGLGMTYLAKRDSANALMHAKKAYQLGKPAPDLRDRLVAAGVWTPDGTTPSKADTKNASP